MIRLLFLSVQTLPVGKFRLGSSSEMHTGTYGLKGHWGLKGHFSKKSIVAIFGDSLMMGAIYMSSWVIGTMFS